MGAAHRTTEVNILPKLNENISGDMDWTQKCMDKDGWTDGQPDKGHSYNPPYASWWGLKKGDRY